MAAAGVANTALMSAFERTREIGTLLSLGMPAKRVRRLLILESGLIGGVGTVLGLVVGTVIATHFARHGLRFEVLQQAESVTLMPPILYFELRTSTLLIGATLGLSVAVLAAAWPASRASKLSPIDALRENG
jgi:ABC-type antimicrobial peptide transport system permease subunit